MNHHHCEYHQGRGASHCSDAQHYQATINEIFTERGSQRMHLSLESSQIMLHQQNQYFNTFVPDLYS